MDEASIRKYAKLMREEDLTGLEITEDGVKIRLERSAASSVYTVPAAVPAASPAPAPEKAAAADDSSYITSPMVGVAYMAPTENSEPFVKLGDKVKAGDRRHMMARSLRSAYRMTRSLNTARNFSE